MNQVNQMINFRQVSPCYQAVAFARVSCREQEQGASHDAQLDAIRRYCDAHNLNIIKEVRLTESSTKGGRVEFHKMLEFVKKQKNKTAIVVHCVDRFQRSFHESVEIDSLLKDDRIEVHFYKEGLILNRYSTSADILRWDMGILSAKMYVGALRDNVNRSMEYNWSLGKWQGFAPTGYLNTRDANNQKTVIIDPERGPLVKKMFEEYATGLYSLQDMAVWTRIHGLTSLLSKEPLSRAAIHKMFQNPFYYGVMRVKGNYIRHIYTPLIDKELFDKVQDILDGKNKIHAKTEYGSIDFAMRGLFHCGECGCAITSELHTKKSGKQYIYLRCTHGRGNCCQKPVPEKEIIEQIESELTESFNFSPKALSALKASVREYINKEDVFNQSQQKQLQTRLSNARNRLDNAINLLLDGVITKDVYEAKKVQLDKEIAEIESELAKYTDDYDEIGNILENIVELAGNARFLLKSSKVEQKRAFLKLVLLNSSITDKKAWISLKKPFDLLKKSNGCKQWLRGMDLNHRPSGYEPDELPDCSTPR